MFTQAKKPVAMYLHDPPPACPGVCVHSPGVRPVPAHITTYTRTTPSDQEKRTKRKKGEERVTQHTPPSLVTKPL